MNGSRDALVPPDDDAALRAAVRAALNAAEPAQTPSFTTLWQRAATVATTPPARSAASTPPRWSYAVAAGVAALALSVVLVWQRSTHDPAPLAAQADVAADLQLALTLAASRPLRVPSDSLLDTTPASMTRGAPSLPAIRYPHLPEENYL